ncbi:hypothetical protein QBC46DRAFT_418031 [Diplogelasinospora grovesii]|uniref:Uncharacterized protein n=1 Tax=Diplogelasinospora grovesii TaxID=303347 RepID=A0AAN6N110_9PEZI|nr:hypothetical protein QBC46DRAFT_418031 [Diplogelasinospora grovesii]
MGNALSSVLGGSQTSKMPQIPSYLNIRTFYPDTTLGIYRFRDGRITLERRMPAELQEGEDGLQETVITLTEPHTPRVDVALAFDFPEPLKSLFVRLADSCNHGTFARFETVDSEIQSQVGISTLSDGLILEPLVCLAIALKNFPLVKALVATRCPPPPENETRFLWNWRAHMAKTNGDGPGISDPAAVTALLRHRWLKVDDAYADQIIGMWDEALATDRIDALLEVNYSFVPTASDLHQAKYYWLLRRALAVDNAPVAVIAHLVSRVPIPGRVPMYASLVPAAAKRITDDGPEGIEVLLEQGLDVDARQESRHDDDGARDTALHAAVRAGSVDNVRCLLRHGAQMLRDDEGRTPLDLAEQLRRDDSVRVLRDWFNLQETKGLWTPWCCDEGLDTSSCRWTPAFKFSDLVAEINCVTASRCAGGRVSIGQDEYGNGTDCDWNNVFGCDGVGAVCSGSPFGTVERKLCCDPNALSLTTTNLPVNLANIFPELNGAVPSNEPAQWDIKVDQTTNPEGPLGDTSANDNAFGWYIIAGKSGTLYEDAVETANKRN